jgi:hypothetical protein
MSLPTRTTHYRIQTGSGKIVYADLTLGQVTGCDGTPADDVVPAYEEAGGELIPVDLRLGDIIDAKVV